MKQDAGKLMLAAAIIGGLGALAFSRRQPVKLKGQVVLITGGSRGLGYLMACEFARQGCRLSICARDGAELERARRDLVQQGAEVIAVPCDVADKSQIEHWVDESYRHFGRIDILVNNAAIIQVGPIETMTPADFERAFNIIYWGTFHSTWAVLPLMRQQRRGHIVNITSIGGKVSVPHIMPYSNAKAAAVSFSEGLRAELAPYGITVTTIAPGLMRTGAHLNSFFNGRQVDEYTWFSLADSLPFISMDAARAARQIVKATKNKEAEIILSLPANILARFHGLFPGVTANLLGWVARLILPSAENGAGTHTARGMEVSRQISPVRQRILEPLLILGTRAAQHYHQHPGPVNVLTEVD